MPDRLQSPAMDGNGAPRGRGAATNPRNRFAAHEVVLDPEAAAAVGPATRFFADNSRSILSPNDSPDLPYDQSLNPYRGCEHGCAYCYARPYHEFLGFSAGLDFESRILVKQDAAKLLERELRAPRYRPAVLALSGATDCYQPAERSFRLTRACLEVLLRFRNPVGVITKNALVTRDRDLLGALGRFAAAAVTLSITTLDAELAAALEPRASTPAARLAALAELAAAGIPTAVMVAPVIPGLNDHEIPEILAAARRAGAQDAGYQVLRLPHGVAEIFLEWLENHRPLSRAKVVKRLASLRGGRLHDGRFGVRLVGEGIYAREIADLFQLARARAGFRPEDKLALSVAQFCVPGPRQGELRFAGD